MAVNFRRIPSCYIRDWKYSLAVGQVIMDRELQIVLEDLDFLGSEWDQDVSDESLRRSSPVLRRFLVEGQLLKSWHNVGLSGQPEVLAPSLNKHLAVCPLNTVRYATAGGADYQGMTIALLFETDEASTPMQRQKISALGPPEIRQTLTEFTDSACVIVEGTLISRLELVKYVVNKLGGAHYDSKREKDYQRLLDYVGRTRTVAGKNAVYFELLSIGQTLVKSSDIGKLRDKLRHQSST